MADNLLYAPDGFKDYLPDEYFFKRGIEDALESVFHSYGYSSVKTPALEYADVFTDKGSVDTRQMYRTLDREGNMLAMRSDVTPPVARIVAANYADRDMPMRFCYVQDVYRSSPRYQGRLREITQAGIELIGAQGDDADAETLAVAIDALASSGLEDFSVDVGHSCFLQGVLEESGLCAEVSVALHDSVIERDFVAAERIGAEHAAPENVRRLLANLPFFSGGADMLDEALQDAEGNKSRAALANLKNIHSSLKDYGFEKYVNFDLSMAGNMDYYTGIIFKGYTSGTGFSILDGGRYDGLLGRFGSARPSVGFIIKVHNIAGALGKQNGRAKFAEADVLVAWDGAGRMAALREASRMRKEGVRVSCGLIGPDIDANTALALRCGIRRLLYFSDGGGVREIASGDPR